MDAFSSKVAENLFAAFPEWKAAATEKRADDGSSYLVVRVVPPAESKVEHPLHIDTANREVTVSFGSYHSHYDQWTSHDGKTFGSDAAADFLRKLLAEEIGVVSWWKGSSWIGSAQFVPGEDPKPPFNAKYEVARIRSWRGTHSRDVVA